MAQRKKRIQVDAHIPPRVYALIGGIDEGIPEVADVLMRSGVDFDKLIIRQRGDGDWSAVLKRYGEDGSPEVAFGNGYDLFSCLLGLDASVKKGAWRPDRPYQPEGSA